MVFIDSLRIQHRCENTYNSVDWVVCPVRFPSHTIRHTAFPLLKSRLCKRIFETKTHNLTRDGAAAALGLGTMCGFVKYSSKHGSRSLQKRIQKCVRCARMCTVWLSRVAERICLQESTYSPFGRVKHDPN